MKYSVSPDALFILKRLEKYGHGAHIVGGSVRDLMLGKNPSDYDMTTSATPEEIKAAFSDMKTVDTGIKHGTVTVLYKGKPYEITTYRTDIGYTDNRHPDEVAFTRSLTEDLARRDFTVNAMCLDSELNLTDAFGGKEDISKGLVRAVGDPETRFREDALRIMRALRFSSSLGFEIEHKTADALVKCKELLSNISGERIYAELKKLISADGAYGVISKFSQVMAIAFGMERIVLPDSARFLECSPSARLISLFSASEGCGAADAVLRFSERLHTDSAIKKLAVTVVENLNAPTDTNENILFLLSKIGEDYAKTLLEVKYILSGIDERELLPAAISSGIPYKISQLSVGGDDLRELGIVGKNIGESLNSLLRATIFGEALNTKAAAIEYIKKYRKSI